MFEKTVIISLTGGLGNQLFQLAEGLSTGPHRIYLLSSLGKPRCTADTPDILHFSLPRNCFFLDREDAPRLIQKVAGLILRKGIKKRGLENYAIIDWLISITANFILICYLKKLFILRVSNGVGFSELRRSRKDLLIGYFQHRHNLQLHHVENSLRAIEPIICSKELETLIQAALLAKPIFVHYRLTDYLTQDNFGTPSSTYYASALEDLSAVKRNIWVFSDDIVTARERFPQKFKAKAKFIDDSSLTPAQTLHLFRFGFDYVIANSTFSWWGAALRQNLKGKVIAPSPWFKGLDDPLDLIPNDWLRGDSR